ncbi:6-carboxytetrahydropterin synthase [Amaricoccus sp.]|uniref:6-pyruvoyl trahydropterin synthase family protein n=1 Tax=Amaricoccus sp. TaxID=1872485 RepID=UPI001B43FF0E|nr:6-carboxytetrahydropterin synthase [Amaricoccus sp.]MBP7002816.1 6-carboxytetrahydropterin synthase [Amaricoccus sp.]
MYAVEVRDHVMIAHSLPDPVFGPAQGLHGATYVVDAAFFAEALDAHGIVCDIGLATQALAEALAPLRYRNLDELPVFAGRLTTTEALCGHVWDALAAAARSGGLGEGGRRLARLRVTLHESHVARAWREDAL